MLPIHVTIDTVHIEYVLTKDDKSHKKPFPSDIILTSINNYYF